ncbi:MAG: tellurium resistance protein [Alphaproteobacteria bacterium HGW-Alphaproteobacteria-2]|nr:MAG: tellurium resistance protein [Alphaproteobacteria bacterium HGW-Alphaproteobacteria-2]
MRVSRFLTGQQAGGGIRRMPPAVFPPLLGFLGLGLVWRNAPGAPGGLRDLAETALGMGAGGFGLAFVLYAVKVALRPGVLAEEIATLPGRSGLAAMAMAVMLAAAALAPYSPGAAPWLLALALGMHGMLALAFGWRLATGPAEARRVSPADHLVFVGGIAGVVPAMRPLLVIHLSPVSLAGTAAVMLGHDGLALGLGLAALVLAVLLLVRLPWLCTTGFSPFWGAFTFPMVAFAGCMLLLGEGGSGVLRGAGIAALVLASVTVPVILARVLRLWLRGNLAVASNAAIA